MNFLWVESLERSAGTFLFVSSLPQEHHQHPKSSLPLETPFTQHEGEGKEENTVNHASECPQKKSNLQNNASYEQKGLEVN